MHPKLNKFTSKTKTVASQSFVGTEYRWRSAVIDQSRSIWAQINSFSFAVEPQKMSTELKLRYHNSFIDVLIDEETPSFRAQSLSPKRAENTSTEFYAAEKDHQYVRSLSEKLGLGLKSVNAPTSDAPTSPSEGPAEGPSPSLIELTNPGSAGHPHLCRRPCLHFRMGYCGHGGECNFCHEAHPEKAAKLDKKQREIMQKLSSKEVAALIFEFVKSQVSQTEIVGGQRLLDLLEVERQGADITCVQLRDLRHLRKTLSRLNLYSLLGVFTNKSSMYPEDERSKVECIFVVMHEIRQELILQA